jgi:hypothetical protein
MPKNASKIPHTSGARRRQLARKPVVTDYKALYEAERPKCPPVSPPHALARSAPDSPPSQCELCGTESTTLQFYGDMSAEDGPRIHLCDGCEKPERPDPPAPQPDARGVILLGGFELLQPYKHLDGREFAHVFEALLKHLRAHDQSKPYVPPHVYPF